MRRLRGVATGRTAGRTSHPYRERTANAPPLDLPRDVGSGRRSDARLSRPQAPVSLTSWGRLLCGRGAGHEVMAAAPPRDSARARRRNSLSRRRSSRWAGPPTHCAPCCRPGASARDPLGRARRSRPSAAARRCWPGRSTARRSAPESEATRRRCGCSARWCRRPYRPDGHAPEGQLGQRVGDRFLERVRVPHARHPSYPRLISNGQLSTVGPVWHFH